MNRPTRVFMAMSVLISLVFWVAGCGVVVVPPTPTPLPTLTTELPLADEAAFAFLQAWERGDYAAMYSLLHFGMFSAVGAIFALVAVRMREMPSLPVVLAAGLFVTLQVGLVTLNTLVGPDLIAAVGLTPVVLGNLSAAGAMTAFYLRAFEIGEARIPVPTTLIGDSE